MSLNAWFSEAQHALAVAGPLCSRANTLIATSRKQIEVAAVLWAQASFVAKSVQQQLDFLQSILSSFVGLQSSSTQDFELLMSQLDAMDHRLDVALKALESTTLDRAFSKNRRTLRSFVFEDGIHQLRKSVVAIKDDVFGCDEELTQCISKFEKEIKSLSTKLSPISSKLLMRESLESAHDLTDSIAKDAHEMAKLLESLTRHYDLCLKSIELSKAEQTLEVKQESQELVQVLERDSKEVEEVVAELYDRKNAIEEAEQVVSGFHAQLVEAHNTITISFDELNRFTISQLRSYSKQLDGLLKQRLGYLNNMSGLLEELEALVKYYELFRKSYHATILEILRRKKYEELMAAVVKDMSTQLSQMHHAELDARQKFIKERGDYLPSDLWEGLMDQPKEPKIDFEQSVAPDLSGTTISAALKEF